MVQHITPPLAQHLRQLAEQYDYRLSHGDLNRRLAHHISLVAPEMWLAQELAYIVNDVGESVGLNGWNAVLEQNRVDVTLIPQNSDGEQTFLELKLMPPDYWENWHGVYRDLACHPTAPNKTNKLPAHYSICFLTHITSPTTVNQRPATATSYRDRVNSVPMEPAVFTPITGFPPLQVSHSSQPINLNWPYSVPSRYPEGFEATMRILWISRTTDG